MNREPSRRRFREYLKTRWQAKTSRQEKPSASEKSTTRHRSFLALFSQFLGLLRAERSPLGWALVTLTIATLLRLIPPLATKLVIDHVLVEQPMPWTPLARLLDGVSPVGQLWWIASAVFVVSVAATAVHLTGRWFATRAVNRLQVSLRHRLFSHAVHLPLHRVYQMKSGGTASLLREDAGGASDLIFSLIYNPWGAIVQLIGSLIALTLVDWRLMLGGLLLVPLVYVTHRTWISRIRPLYRDVRAQRQAIDGLATEAFGGMRVVRAFARERSETSRYVIGNNLLVRQQLLAWWWSRVVDVIWEVLIPLSSTFLLLYGGYSILQGTMTLGDLTMFLFYLAMLLGPLATLASSATSLQNNLAGLDRILDILAEPREMEPDSDSVVLKRKDVKGELTLQDVSFHYPESSRKVLAGVHLDVMAGETIALVGRSGAGKTTLCNLVARFYDPTSGVVKLDGRDLREIQVRSYRSLLGIVEQDVFLFDGTVRENIGYALSQATEDEIVHAAELAHADEFIRQLDRGYDTVVGERGVRLSGGQKQRLAIARALLADPLILILDEATSNLDSENEQLIQDSLRRLMDGRTSFIIAHRLSTLGLADRIIVLEDGHIVEQGTHDELMTQSGHYRHVVELQTSMRVV
ncbi:MAG: ABC transporter ATP-binding protein [Pirellulaceae bacterium]|nr:ABC transporter ATP-binding protein [Planctomycetales bacterium]